MIVLLEDIMKNLEERMLKKRLQEEEGYDGQTPLFCLIRCIAWAGKHYTPFTLQEILPIL